MYPTSIPSVPCEIWKNIFALLPRLHDLNLVSLVSRGWQILAFPYLHHTVHLTSHLHLEHIAKRISRENIPELSLSRHVQGLVCDWSVLNNADNVRLSETNLHFITTILALVPRLEHFSWDFSCLPKNDRFLESLQTTHPNLCSLTLVISEFSDTDLRTSGSFKFEELLNFSLSIPHLALGFGICELKPFVSHLRASSRLQSLELDLGDPSDSRYSWSPNMLFTILEGITFPDLHTFRVLGRIDPGWYCSFFKVSGSSAVCAFFVRHPRLHTIALGGIWYWIHDKSLEPALMEGLFPSLTSLDAPPWICGPVMTSQLSNQIQHIRIVDFDSAVTGADLTTISQTTKRLPRLQSLTLDIGSYPSRWAELERLLGCAPGLEELDISWDVDQLDNLFALFPLVPNLRALTIWAPHGLNIFWHNSVLRLAQAGPRLQRIKVENSLETRRWSIERGSGDHIVVYIATP
ncbi:hypothetical protein FRC08_002682 [Ceratobasidium sp. 394]|nr:hypothetical protein FRC08_002682 [Ceratobasidium sp. 394]KAG9100281.1 hypothetical protein FS749_015774 [Ceratobasidium sp. UAMH 11750]